MITRFFIPEHIKGYYLIATRILGFEITKSSVKAAQIYCTGNQIEIEKFYEVPIQFASDLEFNQATSAAIKIIIDQAPAHCSIISALSSTQVIFKEIKLPFIGIDTIKKVVAYEVEPLLPFGQQDAVIDGMVTKEIPSEKSSQVLVAAVQNQYIAQHLALFAEAGVNPEKITVDLFALYGLYKLIPAYAHDTGGRVLLEIEPAVTKIAFIQDRQLRFIRTFTKGLNEPASAIAQSLQTSPQEAYELITRFGLQDDHDATQAQAIRAAFNAFFPDVLFTLQSFATLSKSNQIAAISLCGTGATIKGLPDLLTQVSGIPTELFQIASLIHNGFGISAKTAIPQSNMISLATALPKTTASSFNLRQKEFSPSYGKNLIQQLLVASAFILLILSSLVTATFIKTRRLQQEATQSEQEAVDELKKYIPKAPEDATTLEEMLAFAKTYIQKEEKVWSAFSDSNRAHFLQYLAELTSLINKDNVGLVIEKLTINEANGTIVLKGQVKGPEELRLLEHDLEQSKLFSYVERNNDWKFTKTIRLAKTGAK